MAASVILTANKPRDRNTFTHNNVADMKFSEQPTSSPPQPSNESDTTVIQTIPKFRIPKITRVNTSPSSEDLSSPVSTSSQRSNTKSVPSPPCQSNEEPTCQQGKRKVSLTQYKEHKRLKLTDHVQNSTTDIDMRIHSIENLKTSVVVNDDSLMGTVKQYSQAENISKGAVLKSNLSEPGVKKLIKKKVIWADTKNRALVETSFFEVDDLEQRDMHAFAHQCATANLSLGQLEKLMERDLRKRGGSQDINADQRPILPPLPALRRILLPASITIPVVNSQERVVQEEREKAVLQALLMRSFLPHSPGEPDGNLLGTNTNEQNETKSIPLDNSTPSSKTNEDPPVENFISTHVSSDLTITPSLSTVSLDNLSPEVAQILARAKGNLTTATHLPPTVVNTTQPTIVTPTNLPLAPSSNLSTNYLSSLLNGIQPNSSESTQTPSVNLPPNFGLLLATHFPLNQLLENALSLAMRTPQATLGAPVFQPTFHRASTPVVMPIHSNNNSALKSPSGHFLSPLGSQASRFPRNNERRMANFRGNTRGYSSRRGSHQNHNNGNRRGFFQNRNNKNNTRNIFS